MPGYRNAVGWLANLQLLGGIQNTENHAKLPEDWRAVASPDQRDAYLRENNLEKLPRFPDFVSQWRERMCSRPSGQTPRHHGERLTR